MQKNFKTDFEKEGFLDCVLEPIILTIDFDDNNYSSEEQDDFNSYYLLCIPFLFLFKSRTRRVLRPLVCISNYVPIIINYY